MAKISGLEVAGNLAHLAKALYDIIKAFMQGGWPAAGLQAEKHNWPQILAVALVLLLLPVIIFCCLPMMLFGWESSTDTNISAMTVKAESVSAYYDNYETYIDEWVDSILDSLMDSGDQNTETDDTPHDTDDTDETEYEVVYSGSKIQKNWFIALHTVTLQNDLNAATQTDIHSFAEKCFEYTITSPPENTDSSVSVINISYLSPEEIMNACNFSDADKNWATLIHKTLEEGGYS